MSEIFERIASEFLPMLSGVLKDDFTTIDAAPDEKPEMMVSFSISGDITGALVVAFYMSEQVAKRFLSITIGDVEIEVDVKEACQEVANQVVGRILGVVGDIGVNVEISYPGMVVDDYAAYSAGIDVAHISSNICGCIGLRAIGCSDSAENIHLSEHEQGEGRKKVLIVDDSPVMCAFLEKIFLERNYDVVAKAADGVEALELFEKHDPDLVTLDIVMPKLKGTDVLKRMMELRPEATVVMASSVSDARTVMNCLKMGAKRYIVKPYDRTAVITAVEKALGVGGK